MHRLLTIAACAVAILAFAVPAQAQSDALRIGVVNAEKIVLEMPEYQEIQRQLTAMQQAYQDTLQMLNKRFEQEVATYEQQQGVMDEAKRQEEERRLLTFRNQIGVFQEQHLGQQGTIMQRRNQMLQPLLDRVNQAINVIAEQEKLTAVLSVAAVYYADKKLDITFKVLDYLQRS